MLIERGFVSPFKLAQIIFIHMHPEMHRSRIYGAYKKTLDSLRKHFIHKRKQLHKIVIRKEERFQVYSLQGTVQGFA